MKDKDINTKEVLSFLASNLLAEKRIYLATLLMIVSALVLGTVFPYLVSNILAELAKHGNNLNWNHTLLMLVVLALIGYASNRIGFTTHVAAQARINERVQNKILHSLLQKDSTFYANRMSGKITSDAISTTQAQIRFQDTLLVNVIPFLINILVGVSIVLYYSSLLALGLVIMVVVAIGSGWYFSRKRAHLRAKRHEALRAERGYLADIILNNGTVKAFAQKSYEGEQYAALTKDLAFHRTQDWKLIVTDGANRILALLVTQILFIYFIAVEVGKNPDLLAAGIFAFSFILSLSNKLFEITSMIQNFENAITDASSMVETINEQPGIIDAKNAKQLQVTDAKIMFNDVMFAYADAKNNQDVLFDKLNMTINPGEKIGLVGHSGGGKTTVTKLLLRLVDTNGGNITIDSQDIKKVTQETLRKNIAYVSQEPLLFHRSLAENIAYGNLNASTGDITKAAKLAHAHEFIEQLADSYDTLVGERGVKLSGGQRQRVAIARAILKDAPILVLDEATSALDSESEVLIQDALWNLMQNRTAIVIAHRLSTIQKMDRIIVLEKGKIIEDGSHQELLAKKGVYAKLWAHQSGGFIEE